MNFAAIERALLGTLSQVHACRREPSRMSHFRREAMTEHLLEPSPETTADVFSRERPPVLTVDPGDTVVVRSLDASGHLERQRTPGEKRPRMFSDRRGHCLTGPVAVRGATPGDVLAVRLVVAAA